MRENRSSWNIDRTGRPLGVELVNTTGDYFFIHAEKLIALQQNPGKFVRVKNKDNQPLNAIYHHPGEIFGKLQQIDEEYGQISLLFGYAARPIKRDQATNLLIGVHFEQHHLLPMSEISSLSHVLSCMYVHRERFNELKLLSETCKTLV